MLLGAHNGCHRDDGGMHVAVIGARPRESGSPQFATSAACMVMAAVFLTDGGLPSQRDERWASPLGSCAGRPRRASPRSRAFAPVAIFSILRYTGMRRESVATLRMYHLDGEWGLRRVPVKGGKTRDIPLPSVVMQFLHVYVERVLATQMGTVGPDTPLFWSTWGRRAGGKTRAPMTGKNTLATVQGVPAGSSAAPSSSRTICGTGLRWKCSSSITTSRRCAPCSGTRASIRPRSTRASGRRNSSAQSASTRRRRRGFWAANGGGAVQVLGTFECS